MKPGIIPGRIRERITLRLRSLDPHSSELTAEQVGVIADLAEKYGSGVVHVTPRQSIEIPEIESAYLEEIMPLLTDCGLAPGSSERYMRNVTACSRWCLYNALPLSDLAMMMNKRYQDRLLPGKTDISLSGCDFSCVRSRTSDIGIIARADIDVTEIECKHCSLCFKEPLGCQVDAVTVNDEGVFIDKERCVRCGFCTNVCKPGTIAVRSTSYDIFLGGCGGLKPREARLAMSVKSEDELFKTIDSILDKYSSSAKEGERIADLIEREGLEALEVGDG